MSTTSGNGWIAQSDRLSREMNAKFDESGFYRTTTLQTTLDQASKPKDNTISTSVRPFDEKNGSELMRDVKGLLEMH